MKFIIKREQIFIPLQKIVNVIEGRQTIPILANVLIKSTNKKLSLTGSDLEIQLISTINFDVVEDFITTVPARKLLDICRLLPVDAQIELNLKDNKLIFTSGRGRYVLAVLAADDYPEFKENKLNRQFTISSDQLKNALDKTLFCMANQDVRFYLNGLMLNISNNELKLVASDGHRLGIYKGEVTQKTGYEHKIIIPRKGVIELSRLLGEEQGQLSIQFSDSNIKVMFGDLSFSAKLIDAQYPDFNKVLNQDFLGVIKINREGLKDALKRAMILSNQSIKAVTFDINHNTLKISTNNLQNEEAKEELPIEYESKNHLSIAFNAQYLLDVIAKIDSKMIHISVAENSSTCLLEDATNKSCQYVVMPVRL